MTNSIASPLSRLANFFEVTMNEKWNELFEASARHHRGHLCPRQVLGVRMGLWAGELLGLDLPRHDKRLFAFVETDGCMTDGIAAATGCWWGSRTMYLMDYGKTAATFVDVETKQANRISPHPQSRQRAAQYAPAATDRWHAQLAAYQMMPTEELLSARTVVLSVSLSAIISEHGHRIVCQECGEDVINEREVKSEGQVQCRVCAGGGYYETDAESVLSEQALLDEISRMMQA